MEPQTLQVFIICALMIGVLQIVQGLKLGARPGGLVPGRALQGGGVGWLCAAAILYSGFGAQPWYVSVAVPVMTGTLLGAANGIKTRDRARPRP